MLIRCIPSFTRSILAVLLVSFGLAAGPGAGAARADVPASPEFWSGLTATRAIETNLAFRETQLNFLRVMARRPGGWRFVPRLRQNLRARAFELRQLRLARARLTAASRSCRECARVLRQEYRFRASVLTRMAAIPRRTPAMAIALAREANRVESLRATIAAAEGTRGVYFEVPGWSAFPARPAVVFLGKTSSDPRAVTSVTVKVVREAPPESRYFDPRPFVDVRAPFSPVNASAAE